MVHHPDTIKGLHDKMENTNQTVKIDSGVVPEGWRLVRFGEVPYRSWYLDIRGIPEENSVNWPRFGLLIERISDPFEAVKIELRKSHKSGTWFAMDWTKEWYSYSVKPANKGDAAKVSWLGRRYASCKHLLVEFPNVAPEDSLFQI